MLLKKSKWIAECLTNVGEKLKHLRFTDDEVTIADNLAEMESTLQELKSACCQDELGIEYEFWTTLVSDRNSKLHQEEIDLVEKSTYFGHEMITGRDNQT